MVVHNGLPYQGISRRSKAVKQTTEGPSDRNPLVVTILAYIRHHPGGCTLFDVVSHCDQVLQSLASDSVLSRAFEKNFFVMNGLYQVQNQLWAEHNLYLSISPMDIHILPSTALPKAESVAKTEVARDASLASYYLDWNNLTETTEQDIAVLLKYFWQRLASTEQVDWAVSVLDVKPPLQPEAVIAAYRKKASITHPDKGGSHADFIAVRQAYEVLMVQYRYCDSV